MVLCKAQERCVFRSLVRNDRSEPFDLISISKSISKPNFIFFRIHLLFFGWGKTTIFYETEFSDQDIFFSPEKIAKKSKK
jgi:hypothetical protein